MRMGIYWSQIVWVNEQETMVSKLNGIGVLAYCACGLVVCKFPRTSRGCHDNSQEILLPPGPLIGRKAAFSFVVSRCGLHVI